MSSTPGYTAVMVVPTGIGAAIGGFAGDALPSARLLSSCVDTLITHPNVLNGAMMYWPMSNALYVEGYALDEFAAGNIGLVPTQKRSHAIGLLLDKGIEESLLLRHMHVADAARATLGINVASVCVTDEPMGVETAVTETGASWGSLRNVDTLVKGAETLLERGCTAIAVVARFPEEGEAHEDGGYDPVMFDAYRKGEGVDAIAGIEALISHTIVKKLGVPCAHAPAFSPEPEPYSGTSPKAAAEELGYTFLPCVLANLHKAPQFLPLASGEKRGLGVDFGRLVTSSPHAPRGAVRDHGVIEAGHVDSVIAPASALGGGSVLSFLSRGALVIAVEENTSVMQAEAATLGPGASTVVHARSYAEAAGLIMAHKEGLLFDSLTAKVPPLALE
jgi:hypothetical protein